MTEKIILYGVWLPGVGWLRGSESKALMFDVKEIALETAKRIGGGKIYFIDQSLVDIEDKLLAAEEANTEKWRLYVFLNELGNIISKVR